MFWFGIRISIKIDIDISKYLLTKSKNFKKFETLELKK